MDNKVILVDESIFTTSIKTLHNALENSLSVLREFTDNENVEQHEKVLANLQAISKELKELSEKNF